MVAVYSWSLNQYTDYTPLASGVLQESIMTSEGKPGTTVLPPTTAHLKNSESTLVTELGVSSSVGPPIHHRSSPNLVTAVIVAMLSTAIISMVTVMVGLCTQRRRRQKRLQINQNMATAIADLQENSIDNPMYGGKKLTYI